MADKPRPIQNFLLAIFIAPTGARTLNKISVGFAIFVV